MSYEIRINKDLNSTSIVRLSDGAIIPEDKGNKDYLVFLEFQKEGGRVETVITEKTPPVPTLEDRVKILEDKVKELEGIKGTIKL